MKEDYVSYEQAVKLKELGFNWACDTFYDSHFKLHRYRDTDQVNRNTNGHHMPSVSAPRLDQAAKWLREVKELHILPRLENVNKSDYVCIITLMRKENIRITDNGKYFATNESALSAGIDKALELLEKGG